MSKARSILLVVLLGSLILSGCKDKKEEVVEVTEVVEEPVIENVVEEPEVVAEETKEGMYRSELTNEWIDEALRNQRPIAAMVDNEKTALPHFGLTDADVIYEMTNSVQNDGVTRFMVMMKDWGKIEQLGSIRSVRPTNLQLAPEWNAVVCHDGGPFYINAHLEFHMLKILVVHLEELTMVNQENSQNIFYQVIWIKTLKIRVIVLNTMNIIKEERIFNLHPRQRQLICRIKQMQ